MAPNLTFEFAWKGTLVFVISFHWTPEVFLCVSDEQALTYRSALLQEQMHA